MTIGKYGNRMTRTSIPAVSSTAFEYDMMLTSAGYTCIFFKFHHGRANTL